jgi:hypothetical protein
MCNCLVHHLLLMHWKVNIAAKATEDELSHDMVCTGHINCGLHQLQASINL